jgi:hypothetical protein
MLETCRNYDEIISSFSERFKCKVLETPMAVARVEINCS